MNAEESLCENVFRSSTICVRLLLNQVQATHFFLEGGAPVTWGGVLQASVITWDGVAKSPVMTWGVKVGLHPWDCLRGIE